MLMIRCDCNRFNAYRPIYLLVGLRRVNSDKMGHQIIWDN